MNLQVILGRDTERGVDEPQRHAGRDDVGEVDSTIACAQRVDPFLGDSRDLGLAFPDDTREEPLSDEGAVGAMLVVVHPHQIPNGWAAALAIGPRHENRIGSVLEHSAALGDVFDVGMVDDRPERRETWVLDPDRPGDCRKEAARGCHPSKSAYASGLVKMLWPGDSMVMILPILAVT